MRLPSYRRTLLRAVPLLVVACASGAPSPQPGALVLMPCRPANPAAAEASVDASGDRITVRGHTFDLRPGSVRRITRFRVEDRANGYAGVDIRPHGTRFDAPARLTLSYARCKAEAAGFRNLRIVEVRTGRTEIVGEPLRSGVDSINMTVTAEIPHLSGYLIGGNRQEQ
ncbi:hypothetical protein [Longimicrobium sp.]|uniref:hypothetical protein n=1 Tax=Longimicrobium sp. TaxID=2029185 RepID=UPI003B3A648D